MRKRKSINTEKPKNRIVELCKQWQQSFDDKDYEKALNIRQQAEPVLLKNRRFLSISPPSNEIQRRCWCWFLVFINPESRQHLIKSIEQGTKPEYSSLYPPFNRDNHPIKFF